MLAAQLSRRQTSLLLFDHPDNLRFGETAFPHLVCSFRLGRLYITARELPGGQVTFAVCAASDSAQEVSHFQTLFDEDSVETRTLMIQLDSVNDDVRFAVTLRHKEIGTVRRHEFDGEGTNDPSPFQLKETYLCDTPVILLTVQYPWRHALPEFVRAIDTFAFRRSDFAFIDIAFGPLTDIALADDTAYKPSDLDMLPPIRVRCLTSQDGKPFEFFEQATK